MRRQRWRGRHGATASIAPPSCTLQFGLPRAAPERPVPGHANSSETRTLENNLSSGRLYADGVLSITFDNGREFAGHLDVAEELDCRTYFAKPYHSWERGTNENTNGLLRQYFPKGMDLRGVSAGQLKLAMNRLNHRPRKVLGFKTPAAVSSGETYPLRRRGGGGLVVESKFPILK